MKDISRAIPEIDIVLDQKTYKVRCSFGLLARFEKATGLNPFDAAIWESPSPTTLATIIWAGVVREDPLLTIEDVCENLSIVQARQARDIVAAMMTSGTDEASGEVVDEKKT